LPSPSFIHIRKNALSKDVCESFIDSFEKRTDLQKAGNFGSNNSTPIDSKIKESTDITFHPRMMTDPDFGAVLNENLIPTLKNGLDDYERYYYVGMENISEIDLSIHFNMQKYEPGGGYKVFHCERAGNQFFYRTLAWMIYLNDVEVGGETEFFYQQHFERAEMGKLAIWPSDFTHVHRGLIAPHETKYILTGWFNFIQPVLCKEFSGNKHNDDVFHLQLSGFTEGHHTLLRIEDDD